MSAEVQGEQPEPEPVPATEPPPPYQPDVSLITDLERGLTPGSPTVERR